ncbi:pyrroline-5-carboxylate reductase [Stappia taiwanensis]|uniref:Pyrroline-5-carboxylate reductase n=1 Tax=Stappia taiwanensis TaxID=992267 RepID=A0A838XRL7_9HYPH|nr:pyrroline-5-carboxylate reductase [Stappia taiwanensis]MBA4611206.1 pyrroline-5-carboxylate reductase [Stappia taiwanensis]GGE86780.1 pyrroline-5-carboxylate reductase [Stappia taiwanensis]
MTFSPERPLVLIGAGKMGGAMLAGWMARGVDPAAVLVVDPGPPPEIRELLLRHTIRLESAVPDGVKAGVLMLAIKPQMMDAVLGGLVGAVDGDTLVLSIAAGTPVGRFEQAFGQVAITRVMPNTPAQVGRGMSVAFANGATSAAQRATVDDLLAAIGASAWIEREEQMDAVTAVSGSGPAYVFYLVEAMAAAGERAGLDADLAMRLARQTVCGAGELLFQSELEAAELRRNVTSPKGTTEAALKVLMAEDGLQPVFDRAVAAAKRRSEELAG